ncbi:MAG: EAL domain-containing protein, partial [Firmicutes bacterium]|nr:EAL domain-containing protein [Bacillota bacterium]
MLKSHEKFYSTNGKRMILIVDDEQINRMQLGKMLEAEYEVLYAANGREALEIIDENSELLSLVILDIMMPGMSGVEVLEKIRENEVTRLLPVIVATSDQESESSCLHLDADYIPKPYPQPDAVRARVNRDIELAEERKLITATDRDPITNLFSKDHFFKYTQEYDVHHKDKEMDAILINVNHFRMLNERYGKEYGDELLRRIGQKIREIVHSEDEDGTIARPEADTFLVYCSHGIDYEKLLEGASVGIEGNEETGSRVHLRMGVYANVDKTIDIERRFDRAKMAADTIRNNYTQKIAVYDSVLHESELYAEQLIGDFQTAIENRHFSVFYQPKFDIRGEEPVLSSAEALVRWIHPDLGMISPGVFIPLFEENGMIRQLDHYVWREAAAQMNVWRERFGIIVPVSVNISRIDMFDDGLADTLQGIMREFDLDPREYLLEITESAYTDDSEAIIRTVQQLRELGFRIEMDDFGTGYSSLGMISNLPIDALKLDMMFVRNAFNERKDIKMLELVLDLARHLEVPVIAEGVETREQMVSLKTMGCDLAQGYYFSKPVPAAEFDRFVEEKARLEKTRFAELDEAGMDTDLSEHALRNISSAMSSDFESIYYVDLSTGSYMKFGTQVWRDELQLERGGEDFFKDMSQRIAHSIHPEDQERLMLFFDPEYILQRLDKEVVVSLTFRLLIGEEPVYYRMQAARARSNDEHIIVGLRSVHEESKIAADEKQIQAENLKIYELAQALANQYESIYYVDQRTDAYTIFNTGGMHRNLEIASSGIQFYEDCQHNLHTFVYPPDQAALSEALRRETILRRMEEDGGFSVDYRLLFDGQPVFYRMTAFYPEIGDGQHFMIGIHNVDAEKSARMRFENAEEASATYAQIALALSQDFRTVYYVNVETDHYIEYSMKGSDQILQIVETGEDFFSDCASRIPEKIAPEDRERVRAAYAKERLLKDIDENRAISIAYQMAGEQGMTHVENKAMRLADDPTHIVIGVRNIDAQVRQQEKYEAVKEKNQSYARVIRAISREYFTIYLVDT